MTFHPEAFFPNKQEPGRAGDGLAAAARGRAGPRRQVRSKTDRQGGPSEARYRREDLAPGDAKRTLPFSRPCSPAGRTRAGQHGKREAAEGCHWDEKAT